MKIGRVFAVIVAFAMILGALPLAVQAVVPPDPEPEIWINDSWSDQDDVDAAIAAGAVPAGVVWGTNAFSSLPMAVSRVEPEGTIYIFPGDYDATAVNGTTILHILKPMTLQGLDADGNEVTGCDYPNIPEIHAIAESEGGFSFWVDADNVSFKGLKFVPYGALSGDVVRAGFVIHVTGNNFLMEHCSVVAPELRESAVSNFNRASLLFDTEGAESATVRRNCLSGGVELWDGAGSGVITIESNTVWLFAENLGIGIDDAHPPVVAGNEFEWDGDDVSALWTYASEGNSHPGSEWFFTVLENNYFTEAYVIITDMATLALKEITGRSTLIYAYGSFTHAAEHAEAGDAIVAFHPSAATGISFDSSLMAAGTVFAIPAVDGGVVVFIPKGSLPGDGIYLVNVTLDDPPAELPAGYVLIGGANFTLKEGDVVITDFEGEIVMWFHYHGDTDLDKLAVLWYDPVAEEWVELEFEVDAANHRLIVTVDHWSYFALMEPPEETPETGTAVMWLLPLGLLLLAGGLLMRRRTVA